MAIASAPIVATAASLDGAIGQNLFERSWVPAPTSTRADDGLGPLFDGASCSSCHRQRPPAEIDDTTVPPGTVIRLGNAKGTADSVYGRQLQMRGAPGQVVEAVPRITWSTSGARRIASVKLDSLGYGPLAADTKVALRRAPVMFGVGLLAQIPDSEILSRADPNDKNEDGISGRAAVLPNGKIGRFGWKATQPDLTQQTSMAFLNDMGLSTKDNPAPWGDCTEAEKACRAGPHGAEAGEPEIPPTVVALIVEHLSSLPPPAPTNDTKGAELFNRVGCALCHATPRLANGQAVAAYTDLLLHDMGPGLNDGIKEGAAQPGEWRTAPLWNLAESVKLGGLLHDGRARSVTEAIEWHDGEAALVKSRYNRLTLDEKEALIAFVSGL